MCTNRDRSAESNEGGEGGINDPGLFGVGFEGTVLGGIPEVEGFRSGFRGAVVGDGDGCNMGGGSCSVLACGTEASRD